MSEDQDPMLFGNAAEQSKYRQGVTQQMRDAIEEDRKARHQPEKSETPATLIGGTGLSSGVTQTL